MDTQENVVVLPKWYESTAGPGISATISSVMTNVVPLINFALMSRGVNILPATVNMWVTLVVFAYFSVRGAMGYVRAKKVLGSQILRLKKQNDELGAMLNPGRRG